MTQCKDCDKRYIGCHSNCDLYKKYKEELELVSDRKRKNNEFKRARRNYGKK